MGKFSGMLLCSDWDGTLHTSAGVSHKDVEAIRYFQKNGGLFTICSGRPLRHLGKFFGEIEPNTFVLTLNGAIIADHHTGEILYRGHLDERAPSILKRLLDCTTRSETVVVHYDHDGEPDRMIVESMVDFQEKVGGHGIYKIVLMARDIDRIIRAKEAFRDIDTEGYTIVSSWETSLEILSTESAKGAAVLRLKELTGAKTLITVGDYENDIDMLRAADISYAVYNAPDRVSAHATHHLPSSSSDGAIAAIIEDLHRRS